MFCWCLTLNGFKYTGKLLLEPTNIHNNCIYNYNGMSITNLSELAPLGPEPGTAQPKLGTALPKFVHKYYHIPILSCNILA